MRKQLMVLPFFNQQFSDLAFERFYKIIQLNHLPSNSRIMDEKNKMYLMFD